jgi:hypothetical protein
MVAGRRHLDDGGIDQPAVREVVLFRPARDQPQHGGDATAVFDDVSIEY